MRSAQARCISRPRSWFDTGCALLSFAVFIVLLIALAGSTLALLKQARPTPVSVLVIGDRESPKNAARVFLANQDHSRYIVTCSTEVFRNGAWQFVRSQPPEAPSGDPIDPKSQRSFIVPIPQEGNAWRVRLTGRRALNHFERTFSWFFRLLKLEYPFDMVFQVNSADMVIRRAGRLSVPPRSGALSAHPEVK